MIQTVYDPSSGQILFAFDSNENITLDNAIDGSYDDQKHYIDIVTKTVINKPVQPSNDHIWQWESKSWILDNAQSVQSARLKRNLELELVDRVNPVWYSSLTQEQQTELQQYRQELLDVPQQAGFPTDISWPTKPTWL
jgi:hypothetical protein